MLQKRMECFRLLLRHLAWTEHQFLRGIRDSRKAESLWGMMRGVGWVRKSICQSWLAKGLMLGLGLLCWGFKEIQEEILSEEASTLQIGSVAFPPGQYTQRPGVIGLIRVPSMDKKDVLKNYSYSINFAYDDCIPCTLSCTTFLDATAQNIYKYEIITNAITQPSVIK